MSRTTRDLIEELDQEAANFTTVALAVGFENTTIMVLSNDPDRQQKLDDAVRNGGEPMGLIGLDNHNQMISVQTRAVAEHAEEEGVEGYLKGLVDNFRKSLLEETGGESIEL